MTLKRDIKFCLSCLCKGRCKPEVLEKIWRPLTLKAIFSMYGSEHEKLANAERLVEFGYRLASVFSIFLILKSRSSMKFKQCKNVSQNHSNKG